MDDQAEVQSAEERMVAFLSAEDGEPPEPEVAEEDEAQAEPDEAEESTEEDDSQEETSEPALMTLTHNGEEIALPVEKVKELAQQGYDYTQKTQKVAEERREVEVMAQAVKAQEQSLQQQASLQTALIKEIAKIESINAQLAQYDQLNWAQLSDSDPVQAQKLWFQAQQLRNTREQAQQELHTKHQELTQRQAESQQAALSRAKAELLKMYPDWSEQRATTLRETVKQCGFNDAEISAIGDPRLIKLIDLATDGLKFRNSKPVVQNKVKDKPPVVTPGAKDKKAVARQQHTQLRTELKRSGRSDVAAKLIERLL